MHAPGLDPALHPARALSQPGGEGDRRLLKGHGVETDGAIAEPGQPNAEIGILGDVVGVPGADLAQYLGAEVIRRSAERERQSKAGEAGQHGVEMPGIFGGEHPRQPAVGLVVDAQAGLHAADPRSTPRESLERGTQLIRRRTILGIEHGDDTAAREQQRVVQRLGFGPRPDRGCDQHAEMRPRAQPRDRGTGFQVIRLDHQDDVELLLRIVERLDRLDQRAHRSGLPVQRRNHGVGRQFVVRPARRGRRGRRWTQARREPHPDNAQKQQIRKSAPRSPGR